jgi:2-keto-4-pentenoate hydratase
MAAIGLAATTLAQRRREGSQGAVLDAACRPTAIDTALAIQQQVARELGTRAGGWKCGLPNGERITLGAIHADTIFSSSRCPVWARNGTVRIEPELAFVLKHNLPARPTPYTPADINAAIGSAHLALELIDCRYAGDAQPGYFDLLADGLYNQGVFLGPAVDLATALAAEQIDITLDRGDGTFEQLAGKHPAGFPAAPLYWLVEWMRQRGEGLQAGMPVITGSYAGTIEVAINTPVQIAYRGLGALDVRFEVKR